MNKTLIIGCFLSILITCPSLSFAQKKDSCSIGIFIKNLYDLKSEEASYTADFWIWANFKNPNFKPFDDIEIVNAKQTTLSDLHNMPDGDQRVATQTCKAELIQKWELQNYPFDHQRLQIQWEAILDTSKIALHASQQDFKINNGFTLPGWTIQKYYVEDSISSYNTNFGERRHKGKSNYGRVTYNIILIRNCWGLFFKIFIGLYVSFFVAFLVFFVSPDSEQRFGLSIGGLFAAVGNKYVMDNNIPASINFSLVDKLHDVTFLFILATLIFSVISIRKLEKNGISATIKFDKRCATVLLMSYVCLNIFLIYQACKS